MSFLAPLYLLAGLAVTLPVLFHLIRRTPRGKQLFSSLMFLVPSPPRVTKRSRIEDWLLLLLRGLAVCLIALAFSRPFLRARAETNVDAGEARRWAILLDTSASMRRAGYWEQAQQRLKDILSEATADDTVSLAVFDRQVTPLVTADEWSQHPAADRINLCQSRLKGVSPGWFSTSLATAIMGVAEDLDDLTEKHLSERTVIVISDFQSGAVWEPLRDYAWPAAVSVQVERIDDESRGTNASLQYVDSSAAADGALRLRVSNSVNAARESFQVFGVTATNRTQPIGESFRKDEVSVYVPPGQSRVMRARSPQDQAAAADGNNASAEPTEIETETAWMIVGDDHEFDNVCFVAPRKPWPVTLAYSGSDAPDDLTGLRFFLGPAFPSTAERTVRIVNWSDVNIEDQPALDETSAEPAEPDTAATAEDVSGHPRLDEITMLVVTGELSAEEMKAIEGWLRAGGLLIHVARSPEQGSQLYELAGVAAAEVTEADINRYAMLTAQDFNHPVLAPFADPRYSDFTRIRVWKYRHLDPALLPSARVLIQFDQGGPAVMEVPIGQGLIYSFATGWNRDDSELALWSKFVPLMNGLLTYGGRQPEQSPRFVTGELLSPRFAENGQLELHTSPQLVTSTALPTNTSNTESRTAWSRSPLGKVTQLSGQAPLLLEQPGLYAAGASEADLEQHPQYFAVNLPPDESRTEPLTDEVLEAAGVQLMVPESEEESQATALRERQLMNSELESRQQAWRWLLVAALLLLLLESVLSGRIARKRLAGEQVQ